MTLRLAMCAAAIAFAVPHPAAAATLGALVARCAPHVAPRTALAILSVESGGRWWAVGDNDRTQTPAFAGPGEAIAYARRRVAEGGNIDIGLAQLNSAHLQAFHVSVDEAFEPCTNIALGMSVLRRAWVQAEHRWGHSQTALRAAFEAYNGGPGVWTTRRPALRARVERYANSVWSVAASLPQAAGTAPSQSPATR